MNDSMIKHFIDHTCFKVKVLITAAVPKVLITATVPQSLKPNSVGLIMLFTKITCYTVVRPICMPKPANSYAL